MLTALQTSDTHGVATPEAWQPGDQVIVPPPKTIQAAATRQSEGYDYTDWFFWNLDLSWEIQIKDISIKKWNRRLHSHSIVCKNTIG